MAKENGKGRKPVQSWPVEIIGGENQTYTVPDKGFLNKDENESAGNENPAPQEPVLTPEQKAETAIDELRSRYMSQLRAEYENSMNLLRDERDEALRENWILQQQAQAALPEQLAAAGINGGATETSLANLMARYQGSRNDIRSGYMDNLGELAKEQQSKAAENERSYNERWLDYLMSLAEAEKKYELEKKYG